MKKVFKFIFLAGLIVLIIFLIFNLKSIPNYSKKSGSEIVWKSNYEKYHKGYCLEEDRILLEDEIFKKALDQYFKNSIIVAKKIENFRAHSYGSSWKHYSHIDWKKYDFNETSIAYYELQDIEKNNFNDKFIKYYDFNNKRTGLLELFFGDFKAKEVNPMDIIQIDNGVAYFQRVVIQQGYGEHFYIEKKYFLKYDDGYTFQSIFIMVLENFGKMNISQILKDIEDQAGHPSKVDNCGNLDYDVEESYEGGKEAKGG